MQSFSSGGVRVSTGWLDFSEEQYELAESVRLLRLAETSESGVQGDVRTPIGCGGSILSSSGDRGPFSSAKL